MICLLQKVLRRLDSSLIILITHLYLEQSNDLGTKKLPLPLRKQNSFYFPWFLSLKRIKYLWLKSKNIISSTIFPFFPTSFLSKRGGWSRVEPISNWFGKVQVCDHKPHTWLLSAWFMIVKGEERKKINQSYFHNKQTRKTKKEIIS